MAQGTPAKLTDISVLHEDEDVIIVNKRYDVKVNGEIETEVTVSNQLAHLRPEIVDHSLPHYFRFCHRLDYATSGVLCLGKHRKGAAKCQKAFERRLVKKYYLALVRGHVDNGKDNNMVINADIGQRSDIESRTLMCPSTHPACVNSRSALTNLIVLERGQYDGDDATKVLLMPSTERINCVFTVNISITL
ncbi:RNA pseudouridylate synthase domain-containing protein 1-like isoform X2 [Tubulanus polymorphus]|uniref:RNA pseudouridylate synthase domain-containing protein 1-like isoform X2 n=1 Tax=Tubulanus polymorphus TaxID=672921 RepID=UPI003DA6B827